MSMQNAKYGGVVAQPTVMPHLPFRDRAEAGRVLGAKLSGRDWPKDSIVLGLPRGGVPVAFEVARALGLPLDVIVVRKLGVPGQPELAMGAIASGGVRVLDQALIRLEGISQEDIDAVAAREGQEAERREQLYRAGRRTLELRDRTVILVDDGLATGSTMLAAVKCVKSLEPSSVIVAVPVASRQACVHLRQVADECVCLAVPERFGAVGEWYQNFRQISDAEVRQLLSQPAC
jgi:putative phosphoribosyl transferase